MPEAPNLNLPPIVRERLRAGAQAQAHLEPDLLTAFAERTLPETERQQVLTHLAACESCREVLSLITPAEGPPRLVEAKSPSGFVFSWHRLRWSALAASIAAVAFILIFNLEQKRSMENPAIAQRMESNPPAPAAKQAAPSSSENEPPPAQIAADTRGSKVPGRRDEDKKELARLRAPAEQSAIARSKADMNAPASAAQPAANIGSLTANNANYANSPNGLGTENGTAARAVPAPAAPAANESVAARAEAAPPASSPPSASADTTTIAAGRVAGLQKQKSAAGPQAQTVYKSSSSFDELKIVATNPAAEWRLQNGQIEISKDRGAHWENVVIAKGIRFTALFVLGSDRWAAGDDLKIYHSSGDSTQWTAGQIQSPPDGVRNLVITEINFSDAQYGQATVKGTDALGHPAEELFTSNDGGKTWLYETID